MAARLSGSAPIDLAELAHRIIVQWRVARRDDESPIVARIGPLQRLAIPLPIAIAERMDSLEASRQVADRTQIELDTGILPSSAQESRLSAYR